jgi:hypothetical protein
MWQCSTRNKQIANYAAETLRVPKIITSVTASSMLFNSYARFEVRIELVICELI